MRNRRDKDARMLAHECFDRLWKEGYHRSRTKSYNWLANQLGLEKHDCHIALFDAKMCMRVIQITNAYIRQQNKRR